MGNFPTQIPDCDSHSAALLDFFLSSDTSICSIMAFPPLRKFWSCCCLSFHWLSIIFTTRCPVSSHCLWLFLCLLGWSILVFHGSISLNSMLLLLLVNFVSGFRQELMFISLTITIRSDLTYPHGFQLLVLLSSQKLGLLEFRPIASIILSKGKSTAQRYCLLYLIKQDCLLKTSLRILIMMIQISLYLFSLLELIWNCIIIL